LGVEAVHIVLSKLQPERETYSPCALIALRIGVARRRKSVGAPLRGRGLALLRTELQHSAATSVAGEAVAAPFVLSVNGALRLCATDGRALSLGGARGRAVLALLALAPDHAQPRRLIASMLWSSLELRQALARLRDVLHDLRISLEAQGCAALAGDAIAIRLCPDTVAVRLSGTPRSGTPRSGPLLPELLGIDPQLDRWLAETCGEDAAPEVRTPRGPAEPAPAEAALSLVIRPLVGFGLPAPGATEGEVTDALIAALSRLRSISLIVDGGSGPTTRGDFLLTGNLRLMGDGLRAAFRLTDTASGQIVWAEVLAPDAGGSGDFAADVAAVACACLEQRLLLLEAERASLPGAASGPRGLMLRAVLELYRLQRDGFERAGKLLRAAVTAAPDLAAAHGWLAYWHILAVGQGWAESERRALMEAAQAAERAVTLDPRDARGLAVSGHVRAFLHHEVPEAVALCGRAMEINPYLPAVLTFAGMAQAYAGELETARGHLRRALWLLPRNPHAFFTEAGLATVEMLRGEHALAIEIARGALQLQPRFTAALRAQIAALGHLGREEEARPLIRDLLTLDPRFTLARFRAAIPYRKREHLDHFVRGLRLAGLS